MSDAPPRAPGELAEIERRAFAESMRAWGENDPNPEWFAGDCLSIVLMDCGRAGAMIDTLLDEITALRASGDGAEAKEWRPIETAPKSRDAYGILQQVLLIGRYPSNGHHTDIVQSWWCKVSSADVKSYWERWRHAFPPSHWMPVPAPPALDQHSLTKNEGADDNA